MCGIVGLFAKKPAVADELGRHFAAMLVEMTDRGPDSAGFAVYRDPAGNTAGAGASKLTVLAASDDYDWTALETALDVAIDGPVTLRRHANHAVIVAGIAAAALRALVHDHDATLRINSSGDTIEIFKEKGLPRQVLKQGSAQVEEHPSEQRSSQASIAVHCGAPASLRDWSPLWSGGRHDQC